MYNRLLPVLLAFLIISCSKPANETASNSDSTAIGDLPPNEDPSNDTAYDGNTDGDFFVSDSSAAIVNEASEDAEEEAEEDENRFTEVHTSQVDICGFSNDGKYFVFTQLVPGDYSNDNGYVYVIDAAKNEWAAKPVETFNDEADWTEDEAKEVLNLKRDSVLKKHSIKYGTITKLFDLAASNKVTINNQQYTVDLKVENLMIELRLKGNGKDILLQKDKKVPASRGSVRDYRLFKAATFGDKIAVFVEYDGDIQQGFENSRYYDRKYIAVTGAIK